MARATTIVSLRIARARRDKWAQFMAFVDAHQQSNWIFRGVADAKLHELLPKIGRDASIYDAVAESVIFANFRRRARQFVDPATISDWDLLALGQHHGLPTRLLDWTTNPLIAAYFAVTSVPRNKTARIYAARAPRMADLVTDTHPFACDRVRSFVPSSVAPRIIAQRGLFTIHPDPITPWDRSHVRRGRRVSPGPNEEFDIESRFRSFFEQKLFQLAVDPGTIKSDLDGLCDTLAWQFQSRTAIGAFNY